MINYDYLKYIKIILILIYNNKIISFKELQKILYIDNKQLNKILDTIKQIKRTNILYIITINNKYKFIACEISFNTGIKIGKLLHNTEINTIDITNL